MASRVALVHDFLLDLRGAERVFAAICDAWPDADVFTAVYDPKGTEGRFEARHPQTSFLQRLRPTSRTFRPLLPLYPHAIESLDLRGYDVVVSSSSAWAHGVLVDPGAVHVCYCHNPFRYAWSEREATLRARGPLLRPPLRLLLNRWRQWDYIAAQRVDAYVANSHLTASRVRRYLGREATVLHPPVELERFAPVPVERIGSPLPRAGRADGAQAHRRRRPRLQRARAPARRRRRRPGAAPAAPDGRAERSFHGPRVSDERVAELLATSRALVVTAAEEFGIAAVESLASGRPVIALGAGGVRESVREGVTGAYYERDEPEALARVVEGFDPLAIDPAACVETARQFGTDRFRDQLRRIVAARGRGGARAAAGGAARGGDRAAAEAHPKRAAAG